MKNSIIYVFTFLIIFILFGCGNSPKLSLMPSKDTIEINSIWTDAGATITIDDEEIIVYSLDTVDTTKLGIYRLDYIYEYKNTFYNTVRYVVVSDQTKPNISLNPGVDTILIGEEWIDAGASATDNSKENLNIVVTESVNNNVIGTYEIKYEATDSSGNKVTLIRYVGVVE
jgi:hypothetical protein